MFSFRRPKNVGSVRCGRAVLAGGRSPTVRRDDDDLLLNLAAVGRALRRPGWPPRSRAFDRQRRRRRGRFIRLVSGGCGGSGARQFVTWPWRMSAYSQRDTRTSHEVLRICHTHARRNTAGHERTGERGLASGQAAAAAAGQNNRPSTAATVDVQAFPASPTNPHRRCKSAPSRRDEVVINRLRIGHTRCTHSYLSIIRRRPTSVHDLSVPTHCQAHPSWMYWY